MTDVEKSAGMDSSPYFITNPILAGKGFAAHANLRGIMVYAPSEIQAITGRDREGNLLTWGWQSPFFYITIRQRIQLAEVFAPVAAIVSSRQNNIASRDFDIVPEKMQEDKIYQQLRDCRSVYRERLDYLDPENLVIKARMVDIIKSYLPDVLPDLSNFDNAIMRWRRNLERLSLDQGYEIKQWLMTPNVGISWEHFAKKWVHSMMVHGAAALYMNQPEGKLTTFDLLPGGTIYPLKTPYLSSVNGYIQIVQGYQSCVYFQDELSYCQYLPNTAKAHGMIPLESLMNQIAEYMQFDKLMADQSDGTQPIDKIIIASNPVNFGDIDKAENIPLNEKAQAQLEKKLNEPKKYRVMTLTGTDVQLVDMTRENVMPIHTMRQDKIREIVGLVFNASNVEMNLTGSEQTSGRATSETQTDVDYARGIYPLMHQLQNQVSRDILPRRYGHGWFLDFHSAKDERGEAELNALKLANGSITVNELREKENRESFGTDYDKPMVQPGQGGQAADGSVTNPLYMRTK